VILVPAKAIEPDRGHRARGSRPLTCTFHRLRDRVHRKRQVPVPRTIRPDRKPPCPRAVRTAVPRDSCIDARAGH
jgi:hypothetical protein